MTRHHGAILRMVFAVAGLLAAVGTHEAWAQDTSVVPVLKSTLTGVVTSTDGTPLPNVNVSLIGETATALTDSAGRFIIREVAPGGHTVLFRRIGFQSVEHRWTARPGVTTQLTVAIAPVPFALNRVVVEARSNSRRRGTSSIGGMVKDSSGQPVAGADVRLLGGALSTTTDSAGQFQFQKLGSGPYIVRARFRGLAAATSVMQLADDDPRQIEMKMWGLPKKTKSKDVPTASGYGIADMGFEAFDRRASSLLSRTLLGPADLFRESGAPLDQVLQRYRDNTMPRRRSSIVAEGVGSTAEGDCLLIDGKRATYRPLSTFNSIGVLLVEVFRTNAIVDDYVVSEMQNLRECRGSMDHHPSYFVLWTRSLR